MSATLPRKIRKYRLEEELGKGGFADVYRAVDELLERTVAIKIPKGDDPRILKRFLGEARLAHRLPEHVNIVRILDLDLSDDDRPFMVQEFLYGADLSRPKPGTVEDLGSKLHVLLDVGHGMLHAHRHGLLHRDLKPANIFLTDSGHAMVIDFGLAMPMEGDFARHTPVDEIVATLEFCAPELFTRERPGPPTDVFSFGVTAYHLLSGLLPYASAWHLPPTLGPLQAPLKQAFPQCPASVADLVDRCLSKDPAERPNFHDIVDSLDNACRSVRYHDIGVTQPTLARRPHFVDGATSGRLQRATVWAARVFRNLGWEGIVRDARVRGARGPFTYLHLETLAAMREMLLEAADRPLTHPQVSPAATRFCSAARLAVTDLLELDEEDVQCSLKVIVTDGRRDYVETIARSQPGDDRPPQIGSGLGHPVDENSGWCSLLGRHDGETDWQVFDFFASNDLHRHGKLFKCSRTDWQRFYRSTMVFPLRHQLSDGPFAIAGFLAYDSKLPNAFPELPDSIEFRRDWLGFHERAAHCTLYHLGSLISETLGMLLLSQVRTTDYWTRK